MSPVQYGVPQGSVLGPVLFVLYTQPLDGIFSKHSVSKQSFADDTQMKNSCLPSEISPTVLKLEACITDVKSWMTTNKLQLNDGKTEALLMKSKKITLPLSSPASISVGQSDIPFSHSAKNLGVTLTSDMSMDNHVGNVCKSAFAELRRIASVRRYLTIDATKTLVCAFVLSKIDYCNSLLKGCPKQTINKLQMVQNSAARLILQRRKRDHVLPLLKQLHWLLVQFRIDYKLSTLCFHSLAGTSPCYLSELLSIYTPGRQLRSSSDTRSLCIPPTRTVSFGQRAFSVSAPTVWNTLPRELRYCKSISAFKTQLKTFLFKTAYDM